MVTLHPQPVTITTDLPGRTVAYRIAEVRPQVSGVIVKRLFTEGSEVKAGQQLYQIDPAPFQANLESAQASLARARATLKSAALLAQRYKPLAEAHAVSQQNYDNAIAAESQAEADIALAKAAVDTAHINLTYTRMFSPISGRTGRSSVTEGALVDANQRTALVVVQQLDPIYVDVTQPSTMLLRLQRELANGQLKKVGDRQAQSKLTLEDNTLYERTGKLEFAEVTVDSGTGSVTLRAVFPNPQHTLLPGMFVHEQLEEGVNEQGLLVPQRAITHNSRGEATTMVVGADDTVSTRVIKTERAIGDQWLVSGGVAAGDKVIVVGLQRLRSGVVKVKPMEVSRDQLDGGQVASANLTGVEETANSRSRLEP
ncbi:MAG TPA: efflux RND transporter periplasmic adaptor subunit [Steroidobacteraceae bacterium]|nr:efflux RND transporter periplasmic adaptor subunit [Steroidobacteraceae bacterium]